MPGALATLALLKSRVKGMDPVLDFKITEVEVGSLNESLRWEFPTLEVSLIPLNPLVDIRGLTDE